MSLQELVRQATSRAGIVRVRNALNPVLWVCAAGTPISLVAAYAFRDDLFLRYGLVGLGALPIFVSLGAYLYFMVRQPGRLQSEEFVLRQQELTIIERKAAAPIALDGDAVDEDATLVGGRRSGRSDVT